MVERIICPSVTARKKDKRRSDERRASVSKPTGHDAWRAIESNSRYELNCSAVDEMERKTEYK